MGRRDFNKQGFDLNELQAMRAAERGAIESLRIDMARRFYGELVKPAAEKARDALLAATDPEAEVKVDFTVEAMLARELASTFLWSMGFIKRSPAEQSEQVSEEKKSPILTP